MNLRAYQQEAVDDLVKASIKLLRQPETRQKLVLKAPTGAGKTVMMGAWLQQMARTVPLAEGVPCRRLAYLWIAPNQLHQQSLVKLKAFFEQTRTLRCLEFHDLGDRTLAENDVLFFNWQSISQAKNVIIRENESGRYLEAVLEETRRKGIDIVAVLDEAHFFAGAPKALALLSMVNARFEVDVSATPEPRRLSGSSVVDVLRNDVVKAEMIKSRVSLNPAVHDEASGETLNEYLLRQAMEKHQDLRRRYEAEGSAVRPLLLVQLPNDDKEKLSDLDNQIRETIVLSLKHQYQITVENHKLAVWLSNEKTNLEGIEAFDSTVEVLLFKQAIALGWDCPRAAVLLIFRELQSETFTIQTVGRILRMPEQKHYRDPELNQGYVYTNLNSQLLRIIPDDLNYLVTQRAVRIPEWLPVDLKSTYFNQRAIRNRLGVDFRRVLFETVERDLSWKTPEPLSNDHFDHNREHLARAFWNVSPQSIEVMVVHDLSFHGAEEQTVVAERSGYARTMGELDGELKKFCWSHVGDYAKVDSAPVLQLALIELMERYLGFDEMEATKVLLHTQNRPYVQELVEKALENYRRKKEQDALRTEKTPVVVNWDVPPERLYPENQYVAVPAPHHALQLFFQELQASNPEKDFREFLEDRGEAIAWWYKNGDAGKEHFSVPYLDIQGVWRLFYVDFIIQLRDGTVALFDTKTENSDPNAAAKHNALVAAIAEWSSADPSRGFVGGVLIRGPDGDWRFSRTPLTGPAVVAPTWDRFYPQDKAGIA